MLSRDLVNSLLSNLADIRLNPLDEEGYSINAIGSETLFLHLSTEPDEFLTIYSVLARTDNITTDQSLFVLKGLLDLNQPATRANNTRISLSHSGLITISLNLEVNSLHEQSLNQGLLDFIAALSKVRNQVQQLLHDSLNREMGMDAAAATNAATGSAFGTNPAFGANPAFGTNPALSTANPAVAPQPNTSTPADDYKDFFNNQQPILWG